MKKIAKRIVGMLIVALFLASCSVYVTTLIEEDGSGVLGVIYTLPSSYTCREAQSQGLIPADLKVEQSRTDGGDTMCTTGWSFNNLSELRKILDNMNIVSIHSLEIHNYQLSYDIDVFPRQQDAGVYDMNWALKLPGKLGQHNADSVNDKGLMMWDLTIGKRNRIYAQSSLPIPPTPTPSASQSAKKAAEELNIGSYALVLGAIVAVVLLYRRATSKKSFPKSTAKSVQPVAAAHSEQAQPQTGSDPIEDKLQKLQHLHDKGLLDEQEYRVRRNKILEDM